jgi:hypothetical protein
VGTSYSSRVQVSMASPESRILSIDVKRPDHGTSLKR